MIEKLVHQRIPSCVIIFSSILPRMDSLTKNLQANDVNSQLQDFCSETINCAYINNTETFFCHGEFRTNLYGKYDGLHINSAGGECLAESFWKAMNHILFKNTSRRRRCFNCVSIVHVRAQCLYSDISYCTLCGHYGHKNVNCHWYSL